MSIQGEYDSETILTETQSDFFNLTQNRDNIDFADSKQVMKEILERILLNLKMV